MRKALCPDSSICSPNHIRKIVPQVMVNTAVSCQPKCRTPWEFKNPGSIKPASPERLECSIKNALKIEQLSGEITRIKKKAEGKLTFKDLIMSTDAMERVVSLGRRAAQSNIPVLIEGESGVGKELIARAIQGESERAGAPFITVNCGAIPENLIESTLFGHEKGSFTGAHEKRIGKFQEADGGTLFLDEVGELPLEAQVKLLRALQEGEVDPVGGKRPVKVNFRLISATNPCASAIAAIFFIFGIKKLSRFRANIFVQRGNVAGAFRAIPFKIMGFEELGLPKVVAELSERLFGRATRREAGRQRSGLQLRPVLLALLLSGELFDEYAPSWGPEGNHLYYLSKRHFAPDLTFFEFNYAMTAPEGIYALALREDVPHPFPPKNDETGDKDEDDNDKKSTAEKPKPWDWRILLPGKVDELLQMRGLFAVDMPLEELKERIRKNLTEGYTKRVEQEMNEQMRQEIAERFPGEVHYPRMAYCTDNGAMIAVAGALRLADARPIGEIRAQARWPLDSLASPATTD